METTPENPKSELLAKSDAVIESPWLIFWRRLRGQRVALIGGIILVLLYLVSLFAGFIAPYDYQRYDRASFFHPPTGLRLQGARLAVQNYEPITKGASKYRPVNGQTTPIHFFVKGDKYNLFGLIPTRLHLFGTEDDAHPVYLMGTDEFGRDIFSRLLYGSQISLSIGLIGIVIRFTFGIVLGGIAGYFGQAIDTILMRTCELIMSIPALYLIMALRATFPPNLSSNKMYLLIVVIYSFIAWASTARVIRGMALSIRERQFVLAAKVLGLPSWKIVLRHVLPGTLSYVIVAATLSVPYYILGEVTLSFLGVGIHEPDPSWGIMLSEAQNPEYLTHYPWLLAPGAAIFITVLAFNFLGDGMRDAVDAKGGG